METREAIETFLSLEPFAAFSMADAAAIIGASTIEAFRKGRFLLREHERGEELFILLSGEMKVCKASEGRKEIILSMLKPGAVFGELALLLDTPRTGDVVAISRGVVARIHRDRFAALLQEIPAFSQLLLTSLAARLHYATSRLAELTFLDVPARLLYTLLRLAEPIDTGNGTELLVRRRPPQQELGQLLSASREAISRALKELEEKGAIEVLPDQIRILRATVSGV